MRRLRSHLFLTLACVQLLGCAQVVRGPSIVLYPADGKSKAAFASEDHTCRIYASQILASPPLPKGFHKQQFRYDMAYEQCMAESGNPLPPNAFWSDPEKKKHYLLDIPSNANPYNP